MKIINQMQVSGSMAETNLYNTRKFFCESSSAGLSLVYDVILTLYAETLHKLFIFFMD